MLPLCGASFDDAGPVENLPGVEVTARSSAADRPPPPQATEHLTAPRIREAINVVDTEDAVKYLPSVFIRKRNYGDTQPVMATRVWGVSSSARSLVYADGVLLTALVANNNNIGAPRWALVAPTEIERVDLMYGPFSAAFPGNSMGAVLEITTRVPEKFEATLDQTFAWQDFHHYGTDATYSTSQTAFAIGDRRGAFSVWLSGNYLDSYSQPLGYVTATTAPTGTTGAFAEKNKFRQPTTLLGASGLLHTRMPNAKLKAAYDFGPSARLIYTLGLWRNDGSASVESYLRDAAGQPTFAGVSGFANGAYLLRQQHSSHSLSFCTCRNEHWDVEATASIYRMDRDEQRTPGSASATGTTFGSAGKIAVLGGTGWSTFDVKATWRPDGPGGDQTVLIGAHADRYRLYNPTFNTADWRSGAPATVATEGDGKTHTQALWIEERWKFAPDLALISGLRYEEWRAYDGYNVNGGVAISQPSLAAKRFSPKAVLRWTATPKWTVSFSAGKAYRFATPSELYQLVSTGTTFTSPASDLKPDNVLATELKIERTLEHGYVRMSLFQDDVRDAMIAQYKPLVVNSPTFYSFVSNVDRVRAQGAELSFERDRVFVRELSLSGSVTYLDARTLATSGQGQFGSAIGKRLPNIPEWRGAFVVTYRPARQWSFTAGGRYSGMLYTTLDDADTNPNTYQGFAAWFVADLRTQYRLNSHLTLSTGVDNVLNRKYFVFHPFPQRTFVAEIKADF